MAFTASRLYYHESGRFTAPAIVFLHGGGVSGWMWREQEAYFRSGYHCLIPDLPESGQSLECGEFSHAHAADLAAELIRERVGGPTAVVGLSEGAQVAVELLARHPALVRTALISSALLRPVAGAGLVTPGLLRWSYRLGMAPFRDWDWYIRLNMRQSAGIGEAYFEDFKRSFRETSEEGFVHLMRALRYRKPAGLEQAKARCLVVAGSKEYKAMIESARDLLRVLPNARGVLVSLGKKASLAQEHNWALSAPDLFNRTLEAWIEGNDLPQELWPL